MDTILMDSNIVHTMLESAVCDYFAVDTIYNRIFHSDIITKHKKDLFKKYQMACMQTYMFKNEELEELIEDVEKEIL